jgi:hypothetical protein
MKGNGVLILLMICSGWSYSQTSVYQVSFQNNKGNPVFIASYSSKKIVVALCDAFNPDLTRLRTLDNLNKSNSAVLQVIVVPLLDLGSVASSSGLTSKVLDSINFSFIVCKAGNGKKTSTGQLPLLSWLTNKSSNIHLDNDVENSSQMFVIGENGILYAELFGAGDLTNGNLTAILNAKVPSN